ncbi:MAG TPA: ABC transporter substrate-binding protein, partial [Candidatus Acidoferrales bacterium]|nr:ABC transporter substrate-binding protein [Candidatus Acidoferrales bacterium]
LPLASNSADAPYDVYALMSLTGSNAFFGNEEAKALQIVEGYVNAHGAINGRPLHFIIQDDQSSPQVAVQLMNGALSHKPAIVYGGGVVATCNAISGLVKDDGPLLYCISSGVHPPNGSFIYSSGFSTTDQIPAGIRYLRAKGWTKMAVITSSDATGQEADRIIDAAFAAPENKSVTVVAHDHFNPTDVTVAAQMAHFKQAGAQAIVAWTTGTPLATVLRSMRDAGMDLPVLTTGGNLSYAQMEQYTPIMPTNLIIPGLPMISPDVVGDRNVRRAIDAYLDVFKAAGIKPDNGHALTWDSVQILVAALKKYGPNATAAQLRDYFDAVTRWPGIYGDLNYKASPQRGLTIDTIVVTRWDPATKNFVAVSKLGGLPR